MKNPSKLDGLQELASNDLRLFRDFFFQGLQPRFAGRPERGEEVLPSAEEFPWCVPSLDFFEAWRISGIVGGRVPSSYSESPNLWNPYFQKLNRRGVFFAFDVSPGQKLLPFLKRWLRTPGALDLTITDPYKHDAYQALQSLALPVSSLEPVEQTRTVNHLILDQSGDRVLALNTDGRGMIRALSSKVDLQGKRVMLLGAGGAAASIAAELLRLRCDLWIANRTPSRAQALAESFLQAGDLRSGTPVAHISWSSYDRIGEALGNVDVLLNTVSGGSPLEACHIARLPVSTILAETKYGAKADFVGLAEGRPYVDGRAMLFGQFVEAAEMVYPLLGVSRSSHLRAIRSLEDRQQPPLDPDRSAGKSLR